MSAGAGFCSRCGTAAGPVPHSQPPPLPPTASAGLTPNVAGALAYFLGFITGVFFLVIEPYKNDRFVRFHAFQSIFFSIAYVILWMVLSQVFWFGILSMGILWSLFSLVWTLLSLGTFLLWLFLMYKAYSNERFMLPVIGDYAARQAG